MPLSAIDFVPKGPVKSADLNQFFNLFTGVMVDQPVTFKNVLNLGGSQGSTTVPLKLYGAVGQTSHLLDLYADNTQANPGWGIAAVGAMAWGPGGAAPTDTTLSRVATQNGHSSDTAGLLVSPYLEVAGNVSAQTYLFSNGATLAGPGANPLVLTLNQDLWVQRFVSIGGGSYAAGGGVLSLTPGAGGPAAAITISGTYRATASAGAVAGINSQATLVPAANNTSVYGDYITPTATNPGSLTGLALEGIFIGNQAAPSGYVSNIGLHVGNPTGGSSRNVTIYSEGLIETNTLKATGLSSINGSSTPGVELFHNGTNGYVQSYNRGGAATMPLILSASTITLQTTASGTTLVSGGPFQVNGHIQAANSNIPPNGAGVELWGGGDGVVQAFNRNNGQWTNLYIRGYSVHIEPQTDTLYLPSNCITTANLQVNSTQQFIGNYFAAPSWSTTSLSSVITPISATFTTTGNLLRVEWSVCCYHSAANGGWIVGLYIDGALLFNLSVGNSPAGGPSQNCTGTVYYQPAAGQHTFALGLQNVTTGTLSINSGVYSYLYVTEQKR